MKFRHDFITNSSSTCFIIWVPQDIDVVITDEFIEKKMNQFETFLDYAIETYSKEELKKKLTSAFNKLRSSPMIYVEDEREPITPVLEACVSAGLKLAEFETGSGASDRIININHPHFQNFIFGLSEKDWFLTFKEKVIDESPS